MTRYVALLRGVSPANANMSDLRRCFEQAAGFSDVRTVLASGNVAFSARAASEETLARRCEGALQQALGRSFATQVRSSAHLRALLADDPFAGFGVEPGAKRVVTFLRGAGPMPALPIERDGVRILHARGREVFTAYLPHPKGPVFMTLLEKVFGSDITTRTLDTVARCAAA